MEGPCFVLHVACRRPRRSERRVVLPAATAGIRVAPRLCRVLRGTCRRGMGRRRARDAAAGPFLRRLGDLEDRRPVQGRAGDVGLVSAPEPRDGAALFSATDAARYDRYVGRYTAELARALIEFAGVRAGQKALDVGCGPGALTAELGGLLGP